MTRSSAVVRDFPASSRLAPQLRQATYHDTYEAPLQRTDLQMHEIYVAILGHLPWSARALIVLRNAVVSQFGLHAEPASGVWNPQLKTSYVPGDKIVRFTLYSQDENEIIAGLDDKHLDFRVSVMKLHEDGAPKVAFSTIVFAHNTFGKNYLRFVLPFHKFGCKHLLSQAVAHERI